MPGPRPKITPSAIDRALAKVTKARKRLCTDQGLVARRNARDDVLSSVREYRRVLDRDFPIISRKRKPRRKRLKIRAGFVLLVDATPTGLFPKWLGWIAEAQVPMQVIRETVGQIRAGRYVPEWSIAIIERYTTNHRDALSGRVPSALRKAKKDRSFREVELAAYKLRKDNGS